MFPFMEVCEESWEVKRPTHEALACPYVSETECAFRLRPESRSDWRRDLETLRGQQPRCLLFQLPNDAENLSTGDLRQWVQEAQRWLAEVPIFLAQEGKRFPCGEQAACLQCPQAAARLLREQTAAWTEREIPISTQIQQKFPQLSEAKRAMLAAWALEPSETHKNLPISLTELTKRYRVGRTTLWRWLQEAREAEPEIMRRLEAYRDLRARKEDFCSTEGRR